MQSIILKIAKVNFCLRQSVLCQARALTAYAKLPFRICLYNSMWLRSITRSGEATQEQQIEASIWP